MGDVEDMLGELEDEDADNDAEERGDKPPTGKTGKAKGRAKRARNQDEFELDLDKAWSSTERDD